MHAHVCVCIYLGQSSDPHLSQPKTNTAGAGKTTLLLALLGEAVPVAGGCQLSPSSGSRVAYVSQRPWILNSTLRVSMRRLVVDVILYAHGFMGVTVHVAHKPMTRPTHVYFSF